ncbi:MAG: hypothetical protein BM559_09260 [Roseobacter sp. MedPE-SWchi]|nr:MAG: hypothetical protein BM559_09260 [Roseobacter sp. MedPE-SWchi]
MRWLKTLGIVTLVTAVSSCGAFSKRDSEGKATPRDFNENVIGGNPQETGGEGGSKIWDLFKPSTSEQTIQVNRYLWNATLDSLSFLPVQSVDPFSGVIVTGYGTPPGGGRSYRATVHIKDPALDARSLSVSLQTKGGRPVNASTTRAVEDAILSRARQLRIADKNL